MCIFDPYSYMKPSFFLRQRGSNQLELRLALAFDHLTALVEVNDAWALGLYDSALSRDPYIELLQVRWHQIRSSRTA